MGSEMCIRDRVDSDVMTWVGDEIKLKIHPLFGLPSEFEVASTDPGLA